MSIWFSRKFEFSQTAHGVPAASQGVCGAMVLDWLTLKNGGNYNSTSARNSLVLPTGAAWATRKNALISAAVAAGVGSTWKQIIGHNLNLVPAADVAIFYSRDDNTNVFDPARVLVQANRFLVITIGNPVGINHIVGVYRTPNKYNGYHMFDPNFGEFRGSYAKGVKDWAYAILHRALSGGRTYLTSLSHSMIITPFP